MIVFFDFLSMHSRHFHIFIPTKFRRVLIDAAIWRWWTRLIITLLTNNIDYFGFLCWRLLADTCIINPLLIVSRLLHQFTHNLIWSMNRIFDIVWENNMYLVPVIREFLRHFLLYFNLDLIIRISSRCRLILPLIIRLINRLHFFVWVYWF